MVVLPSGVTTTTRNLLCGKKVTMAEHFNENAPEPGLISADHLPTIIRGTTVVEAQRAARPHCSTPHRRTPVMHIPGDGGKYEQSPMSPSSMEYIQPTARRRLSQNYGHKGMKLPLEGRRLQPAARNAQEIKANQAADEWTNQCQCYSSFAVGLRA